ncbi:MAG: hypothetical protein RRY54_04535, partial [Angelakisella sp.]
MKVRKSTTKTDLVSDTKKKSKAKVKWNFNIKKAKLATKIAIIISAMLVVVFCSLIGFTIVFSGAAIKDSISAELDELSYSNGAQVENILNGAISATTDIKAYLTRAYAQRAKGGPDTVGNIDFESSLYGIVVSPLSSDMEKYITETARNAAVSNPDIVGVSVMFEPFEFESDLESYSFYVSENIGSDAIKPFGFYSAYSQEPYYADALEAKKMVFTDPYEHEGITMVTISNPVVVDGKVKCVISADVNVTNFDKLEMVNGRYPTMYSTVYNENGIITYDTDDINDVGRYVGDFFANKSELDTVLANFAKGESFTLQTVRENGMKVMRFYNPIKAGEHTWWTLTALSPDDMNESVSATTFWLIIISAVSLALILIVVILTLKATLNPIKAVMQAANDISKGNFEINMTA